MCGGVLPGVRGQPRAHAVRRQQPPAPHLQVIIHSFTLIHIIHPYNLFSEVQCDPGLRPQPALHHPLRVHCHGPDI